MERSGITEAPSLISQVRVERWDLERFQSVAATLRAHADQVEQLIGVLPASPSAALVVPVGVPGQRTLDEVMS